MVIEEKRGMTVDDSVKFKSVSNAQLSPDGSKVVYLLRSPKPGEDKYESDIYMVSTDGGDPVRLTEDGKSSMPRWSPDGLRIAFVKTVEEKSQITVMDLEGKSQRKVCNYQVSNSSLGVSTVGNNLLWSPDGRRLAFIGTLEPFDKDAKIKVIDRFMYKAFFGNSDMRRRHLFVVSPLGLEPPVQLTFGDHDEHSFSWSPDGKELVFVANRTERSDFNMHLDIYAVNVESKEMRRITDSVGAEYYPTFSPDGCKIAYIATTRGNTSNESTPEDRHLWVVNSDGSNPNDLAEEVDRSCGGPPQWAPDGSKVYFTMSDQGRTPVCCVSPDGGPVEKVLEIDGSFRGLQLANKGSRMVYMKIDPRGPGDMYAADLDGSNEVRLTSYNDDLLNGLDLVYPEKFSFTSSDGLYIDGRLYKPRNFMPHKKYPALLSIKGGPSGMLGWSWSSRNQVLANHGYVVFGINYRGSSGYGQAFTDAVVGDMLGGEYRDNMEAVDYILANHDYVDPDRLGVFGGSYGGYLTNWIITQTNRFKAAVSLSSISNLFTQWGCSALASWVEVELPGLPWDHLDLMLKQSPIMQADKARTPTMFIHGEKDHDTPIVEAEQMFAALKTYGVDAVLVRYVDEGHGVRRKPSNAQDVQRRMLYWFDKYLKGSVSAT